ncbi:MAG: DedA family protein [Acidobacteriota bacterium]
MMQAIITALSVFASAFLEYIFFPYPGDTVMLLGYFLAGRGNIPLWLCIISSFSGSVAGAFTSYYIGYRMGTSYFFLRYRWVARRVERLQKYYERFGGRLLLINRFLPGLRGVFLYAAGMGRLRFFEVALYSTISNILWLILIGFLGLSVGTNWEDVRRVFKAYTGTLGIIFSAIFIVIIIRRLYKLWKEAKAR